MNYFKYLLGDKSVFVIGWRRASVGNVEKITLLRNIFSISSVMSSSRRATWFKISCTSWGCFALRLFLHTICMNWSEMTPMYKSSTDFPSPHRFGLASSHKFWFSLSTCLQFPQEYDSGNRHQLTWILLGMNIVIIDRDINIIGSTTA